MGTLLAQLVPTALAGGLAPLPVMVVISLLVAPRGGQVKALGFAAAMTATLAVVGAVVLSTAGVDAGSDETGSAVTGTIVAVLGALLVVMALKQVVHAPDPDAGPPRFMARLDTMSVGGAVVLGVVIALINVKQLGIYVAGVSQIVAANVTTAQSWVALLVLLLVVQAGVIAALTVYGLARESAGRVLGAFRGWLVAHNRPISIAIGLVVGGWFVIKGVAQVAS